MLQKLGHSSWLSEPKYFVKTIGCQMNQHDSEKIAGMLEHMGCTEGNSIMDSDLIVYNTCCVRENAEQKLYGHLGILKNLKKTRPSVIIAVCGCMVQQPHIAKLLEDKYKHVDIVFGTHNLHELPRLVREAIDRNTRVIEILDSNEHIVEGTPVRRKDKLRAWVNIMQGCNNFCTYCIVPYVRGRQKSRNSEDILREIGQLAIEGKCKEVTLLGQNVNSYGEDSCSGTFSELLRRINSVDGIRRVRFITSHPKDLSSQLIETMRKCDKICPSLHLPVQSGSSKILKAMNRCYTKQQYIDLVSAIREEIPGVAITTDIIVGFPGETHEDFSDTLDLLNEIRFDAAYTFMYSKREGTPAAEMSNQISEYVVQQRFNMLLAKQNEISHSINEFLVGKNVEVLVEGPSKSNDGVLTGRTDTNKIVNFRGENDMIGEFVDVEITNAHTWWLEGKVSNCE